MILSFGCCDVVVIMCWSWFTVGTAYGYMFFIDTRVRSTEYGVTALVLALYSVRLYKKCVVCTMYKYQYSFKLCELRLCHSSCRSAFLEWTEWTWLLTESHLPTPAVYQALFMYHTLCGPSRTNVSPSTDRVCMAAMKTKCILFIRYYVVHEYVALHMRHPWYVALIWWCVWCVPCCCTCTIVCGVHIHHFHLHIIICYLFRYVYFIYIWRLGSNIQHSSITHHLTAHHTTFPNARIHFDKWDCLQSQHTFSIMSQYSWS